MVLYLIVHKDCFMVDFCYLGGGGGVKLKLENYNTTSKSTVEQAWWQQPQRLEQGLTKKRLMWLLEDMTQRDTVPTHTLKHTEAL